MAQDSEGEEAAASTLSSVQPPTTPTVASVPTVASASTSASTETVTPASLSGGCPSSTDGAVCGSPFCHALSDKAEAALVAAGAAVEARAVVAAAEVAAAEAIAAAQAAVQHERALQLQAVRERRMARHRAKRLRRAIERMAQGDRVELYDLSFEEKTQVAVAGFVAMLLALPLLTLLPIALRFTLLPAGVALVLAVMLMAEIRSGTEQPPAQPATPPAPPVIPTTTSSMTNTTSLSTTTSSSTTSTTTNLPATPLRRPARAAIGPPYAIGGNRTKNQNASVTEMRARPLPLPTSSSTSTATKPTFIPLSPPLADCDGDSEDPYGTLLSLQDSDISLGISGSTYDITVKDKSKSAAHVGEVPTYDFRSGNGAQVPTWISEVPTSRVESKESPISLGDHAMLTAPCKSAFISSQPVISACRIPKPPNGVTSPECGDPDVYAGGLGDEARSSARAFGSLRVQESSPAALSGGSTTTPQALRSEDAPKTKTSTITDFAFNEDIPLP